MVMSNTNDFWVLGHYNLSCGYLYLKVHQDTKITVVCPILLFVGNGFRGAL